jgi:gliding motility-associated-like protein
MATSYLWDFGDGTSDTSYNPQHTYIGAGPFNVTLKAYGWTCSDSMTQTITPILVPVVASFTLSADSVCGPTPITSNNTSVGSNLIYTWFMGDGTTYNTFNITHSYATLGLYTVILQISDTINNCKDTAFATVYVDNDFAAKFNVSPTDLCVGDKIYLKDSMASNTINFSYTFYNGDIVSNLHNLDKIIDSTGSLWVELKTDYPVCASQTVREYFKVDDYPIVKLIGKDIICSGRETVTITDENNPGANYLWSTGATTNFIEVLRPDIYKVTVSYGVCNTNAEKYISPDLDCVFIPNAFTPNGDGRNDYFHPLWFDVNEIGSYQIQIFNRFGQRVYQSDDKNDKGWDGKFKGAPCPSETYMYIINLVSNQGTKKSLKGDVMIIR